MKVDVRDVRALAQGRWRQIIASLGGGAVADVVSAAPLNKHVTCPFHAGAADFRLDGPRSRFGTFDENGGAICTCGVWPDGFALLMKANGWTFKEALFAVAAYLGMRGDTAVSPGLKEKIRRQRECEAQSARKREQRRRRQDRRAILQIRRVWDASLSLQHPQADPARRYLMRRKLSLVAAEAAGWRFHPDLPYFEKDAAGKLVLTDKSPALLAMMRTVTGQPVTIHRTYLEASGRKRDGKSKKLMGYPSDQQLSGGAIRLFAVMGQDLGVAEGLETALSVQFATGMPVWATGSASLLAAFQPPPGIRRVFVWADKDRSRAGIEAALTLKKRLKESGIEVIILMPEFAIPAGEKSIDWNDVWMSVGAVGFPLNAIQYQAA